jgi:ADP-heptose:LPS heptosyltransferase
VPRITCDPTIPGDFAVIHPFSGSARKNWPLDRFRKLAARLPMPVRWCAGPEESLEGATRFDDLYDLGRWLAGARLYIGNDSGITHLASAVGTPVVAIFGPTDPEVWAPRGDRVCVVSAGSLDEIAPDQVLDACLSGSA